MLDEKLIRTIVNNTDARTMGVRARPVTLSMHNLQELMTVAAIKVGSVRE